MLINGPSKIEKGDWAWGSAAYDHLVIPAKLEDIPMGSTPGRQWQSTEGYNVADTGGQGEIRCSGDNRNVGVDDS